MASVKDRLETYRRKRDFKVTPEPPPEARPHKPVAGSLFMVHKHDATRLHYDLRLEIEGALASWSIPKGPSYDPAVKRLAVQTEDHPLEYGNFEGRIPDGEYGAGDSLIWDRGVFETVPPGQAVAMREKGHLSLVLQGEKLKGHWHLVRTRPAGGKSQWIFFKAKDGLENPAYDVVEERPESVVSGRKVTRGPVFKKTLRAPHPPPEKLIEKVWPPMRATLSTPDRAPAGEYVYEVKYDGYRGIAAVSGGKVAMVTRNALDLTARFPEAAKALARLTVGEVVIDGELVGLDAQGVSRFGLLMDPGGESRFVAFDLLWLEGEDLRRRPLEERRELLQSLLANAPPGLSLSEQVQAATVDEAVEEAERAGWEGLVAKRLGSPYASGKSSDWLKLKVNDAQEFAIAGYVPLKPKTQKRMAGMDDQIGALLIAVREGDGYAFAGKVGTGYSEQMRRKLRQMLDQDRTGPEDRPKGAPKLRDAVWVTPRYVAQVGFTEWTPDGRLRHPTFQGLREDKKPTEATRERPERPPRPAPARKSAAAGHEVKLTSGDRVLFPRHGYTKADVFEYYRAVGEVMVRAMDGRPIAFQQFPRGVGGEGFFRQMAKGTPQWATLVPIRHQAREVEHLVVDRPETLLWLANQSALALHVWSSRVEHLSEPDWVVFDLDPAKDGDERRAWEDLVTVATALRRLLEELKLSSVPKTSGKRGLHVLVPLARGHTHQDALEFALAIVSALEKGLPQIATTERSIKERGGRLYLDALQNAEGKTLVAPYSIRPTEDATVSTPLKWSEVTPALDPSAFTIKTVPARLQSAGDLFAPALDGRQRLPRFK
ncbi:MAG TPA: DNA ligase D [Myxococcales bacterium]|nr:DNA ligase D [Myxococcales bacterium]